MQHKIQLKWLKCKYMSLRNIHGKLKFLGLWYILQLLLKIVDDNNLE